MHVVLHTHGTPATSSDQSATHAHHGPIQRATLLTDSQCNTQVVLPATKAEQMVAGESKHVGWWVIFNTHVAS